MTDDASRRAAGGRAASAPLLGRDTEPTLFELSQPGRHELAAARPPACPSGASRSWSRPPTAGTRRWRWPRSPSATWSATSPG